MKYIDFTKQLSEARLTDIMSVDLEKLSLPTIAKLRQLDETLIGTPDYLGIAYFWNHEYRHWLRDAKIAKRREIHNAFLKAGLKVDAVTDEHDKVLKKAGFNIKIGERDADFR